MSRTGDMYIEAHDELITEYLEAHPNATDHEAYKATADKIFDYVQDKQADAADYACDVAKGN